MQIVQVAEYTNGPIDTEWIRFLNRARPILPLHINLHVGIFYFNLLLVQLRKKVKNILTQKLRILITRRKYRMVS